MKVQLQQAPLNVITDNVISQIILSVLDRASTVFLQQASLNGRGISDNVISFSLSQRDPNKRLPLYDKYQFCGFDGFR
jgi:hypothetical protein